MNECFYNENIQAHTHTSTRVHTHKDKTKAISNQNFRLKANSLLSSFINYQSSYCLLICLYLGELKF